MPVADIAMVLVDGVTGEGDVEGQATMGVEIAGAIAPRANYRVYFAPSTPAGFAHAITQATTDGVDVLAIGWGQSEQGQGVKEIDAALEVAARQRVTVLAA